MVLIKLPFHTHICGVIGRYKKNNFYTLVIFSIVKLSSDFYYPDEALIERKGFFGEKLLHHLHRLGLPPHTSYYHIFPTLFEKQKLHLVFDILKVFPFVQA